MTEYPNVIRLSIRGTVFQTRKATLTRIPNWFKEQIEKKVPILRDETGTIFIDRPAKHFEKILNFMTDGKIDLPNCQQEIREIRREARIYHLEGLVKLCEKNLKFQFIESDSQLAHLIRNSKKPIFIIYYSNMSSWVKVFRNSALSISGHNNAESVLEQYKKHFDIYFKRKEDDAEDWKYSIIDKNHPEFSTPIRLVTYNMTLGMEEAVRDYQNKAGQLS